MNKTRGKKSHATVPLMPRHLKNVLRMDFCKIAKMIKLFQFGFMTFNNFGRIFIYILNGGFLICGLYSRRKHSAVTAAAVYLYDWVLQVFQAKLVWRPESSHKTF
jgi:hypothetical protein